MLLVGCKSDLRTDLSTLVELSNHRQAPVSYDQVCRLKEHFEMVDGSNFLTLIRSLPCLIDPCESVQILSLLTQALYKKQNLSKPERFLRVPAWPSRSRRPTSSARPSSQKTASETFSMWPRWPASTKTTKTSNAARPPVLARGFHTCLVDLTWRPWPRTSGRTKPKVARSCDCTDQIRSD